MTNLEKLISLLKAENPSFSSYQIPPSVSAQRQMLRALMNVRMPKPQVIFNVFKDQDLEIYRR